MRRLLPLLWLLSGCYDFAGLPSLYGGKSDLADREAAAPADLVGADLVAVDRAMAPVDLVGADLVPPGPDLTVVDLAIPPGADLAIPPGADLALGLPDLSVGPKEDLAATPVDLAVPPGFDLAVKPPDLAAPPGSDLATKPPDLAVTPDPDLALPPRDLAAPPRDLAAPPPDLAPPRDLAKAPDLVVVASCNDGIKNGAETDLDCGGKVCPRCAAGKSCLVNADCLSLACGAMKCGSGVGLKLSFATQVVYPLTAGSGPLAIQTADFNADGKADLVTADDGDDTVAQLTGTGAGTFNPPSYTKLVMSSSPEAIVVADFNADNRPDWATADIGDDRVTVGTNAGDGTFKTARFGLAATNAAYSITAADFNGDNRPDIVTGSYGYGNLPLLTNNGMGGFTRQNGPIVTGVSWWVTSGDWNGDGRADVVATQLSTTRATMMTGRGDGTFNAATHSPTGAGPYFAVGADFNGDGKLDLAVADNAGFNPGFVSILLGKGDGTFQPQVSYASGNSPISLAVADYNLDGRLDIATANKNIDSCGVLLGNGDGTFVGGGLSLAVGDFPLSIVAGDWNRDGKPDLAVANYTPDTISILINTSM